MSAPDAFVRTPIAVAANDSAGGDAAIPDYLRRVYAWAYLNPFSVWLFDRPWVVNLILWGNSRRLQRALFAELAPGQRVFQSSSVYGDLLPRMADSIGPGGALEVIDVAPVQLGICCRKLAAYPWATVRRADAANPGAGGHDVAVSFFLLHEMPDGYKCAVVDALLAAVAPGGLGGPGGKAVFIDYHRPHPAHPLKWLMSLVFDRLEPFAKTLWRREISEFASDPERFRWRTETCFGGLYQKTVAEARR